MMAFLEEIFAVDSCWKRETRFWNERHHRYITHTPSGWSHVHALVRSPKWIQSIIFKEKPWKLKEAVQGGCNLSE